MSYPYHNPNDWILKPLVFGIFGLIVLIYQVIKAKIQEKNEEKNENKENNKSER